MFLKQEVIDWEALSKNDGKKWESINTENCWPGRVIREEKANMFNPKISKKSRQILERKAEGQEEEMIKHMTAQEGRADYYQT